MVNLLNNVTNIPDPMVPRQKAYKNESEIRGLIDRYIKEKTNTDSLLNKSQEFESLNIIDFLELLKVAIISRQDNEGIPKEKRILFLADDLETLDTESITWSLGERWPGMMNKGSATESKIKEVRPHLYSIRDNPNIPGEKLLEYGRSYDNWFIFYGCAKNELVALKRALWFEKLMDDYYWFFQVYGFKPIEHKMESRVKQKLGNTFIIKYPIVYTVRCNDIHYVSSQELKAVYYDFELSTQ